MNESNSVQAGGTPPLLPAPVAKPVYEANGRERVMLLLALALGVFAADLLLSMGQNWLGLGIPAGVTAWYAVLFWYVGPKKLPQSHSRLFFAAIALLSLTFVLFSNGWFRFWNIGFLLVLLTVHAFQLSGAGKKPWSVPSMLWERFRLLLDGLFGRLGAIGTTFKSFTGPAARRGLTVGIGALVTVPLLLLAAVLLGQADMVFDRLTANILAAIWDHLDAVLIRALLGLLCAPFLFSLLYALGRPKPLAEGKPAAIPKLDGAVAVMALGGLDALYLFFVAVQARALFGGEAYLAEMGISYADYARSGFFQLVFVALLNLGVMLAALQLTGRDGRRWRTVQLLATLLAALSGVILVSAARRMTLYVLAYGLSFKRALTYWGMVMIALLLAAACVKVWRERFGFFRFAAAAALAGWLVLNYANVDRVVAVYNVEAYLNGTLAQIDLHYLTNLSYEALPVLEEKLDGNIVINQAARRDVGPDGTLTLAELLADRRAQATWECSRWETWSLPAWNGSAFRDE